MHHQYHPDIHGHQGRFWKFERKHDSSERRGMLSKRGSEVHNHPANSAGEVTHTIQFHLAPPQHTLSPPFSLSRGGLVLVRFRLKPKETPFPPTTLPAASSSHLCPLPVHRGCPPICLYFQIMDCAKRPCLAFFRRLVGTALALVAAAAAAPDAALTTWRLPSLLSVPDLRLHSSRTAPHLTPP